MKQPFGSFIGIVLSLFLVALLARFFGVEEYVRRSIAEGHLLDWVMGSLSLIWLLVILKAPWDLFFQANAVAFEQRRSQEQGIALKPGRETFVQTVRKRLLWFAIGAHLFSAAIIATITYWTQGLTGYYFAGFYLIATLFRPTIAGYAYLAHKLNLVGEESRYPREDIREVRDRLARIEENLRVTREQIDGFHQELSQVRQEAIENDTDLEVQLNEQRQRLQSLGREFESTVTRLTDNQDVIKGIQAFVRLISKSTTS
jgi:regulator of replication initiation timing